MLPDIIKILAPLTLNPNYYHYQGRYQWWTPIFLAAKEGHTEIVKLLSDMSDDPNSSSNGDHVFGDNTPMQTACENGHNEVVEVLQSYGFKCKCGNDYATGALH